MSEAGVIDGVVERSLGLVEETVDVEPEARMIAALLATAGIAGQVEEDLIDEAVNILDFALLPVVREAIDTEAAALAGPPLVDAVELASCLGAEALGDVLAWASKVLAGSPADESPEALEVFADCLGWQADPSGLPPALKASVVIASFVASVNKALAGRG